MLLFATGDDTTGVLRVSVLVGVVHQDEHIAVSHINIRVDAVFAVGVGVHAARDCCEITRQIRIAFVLIERAVLLRDE